ncbi:MAG TPA: hypothetical protein VE978_04105 [Chitinophagales bacterium]|nr:hypothetical protein [Chitinophagales bacterium]
MLDHIQPENLICIDIETVPAFADFVSLPDELKELYLKKSERLKLENENNEEQYFNHAGIYAEFGKVICITLGLFKKEKSEYHLRIKSLCGDDEKKVLEDFAKILEKHPRRNKVQFCGHNVREFDIPFLCRRFLIHHLELPMLLDISGKKPWDVPMVDTMQLCLRVAFFHPRKNHKKAEFQLSGFPNIHRRTYQKAAA